MWVAPHLHFCKPMLISPANPCPPRSSALHAHAKRRHPLFSNLAPLAQPAPRAPTSFSTSLSFPSARCPPRRLPVPVLVRESTTVKCYMVHPSGNHLVISNQMWKKGLLLAKRGRFRDLLIGHPNGSLPALLSLLKMFRILLRNLCNVIPLSRREHVIEIHIRPDAWADKSSLIWK